jgi:hypothetical protein
VLLILCTKLCAEALSNLSNLSDELDIECIK